MAEVEWCKQHTEAGGCWGEIMLNRPERAQKRHHRTVW